MSERERARALATAALEEGRPTEWFEQLYREAEEGTAVVPWADLVANPHLEAWLDSRDAHGGRALDVGCGYGDNAAALARYGYDVTAFDVSESAVQRATERFSELASFETADATDPPEAWTGAFDLVVEIYTLQVLPRALRDGVAKRLASLVAPGGVMLIVCRGRDSGEPQGALPWPLTRAEIEATGLALERFEDFFDDEAPPVRRFRALLRK